jgi:hypothetical protein
MQIRDMNKTEGFSIVINGRIYDEREKAGSIIQTMLMRQSGISR